MYVNSMDVRAAATLGGAANTSSVNIRGAAMVAFHVSATDAGQLSVCKIQTSIDGTNWVDATSSAPSNGRGSMLAETSAGTLVALNTGGAMVCGYPFSISAALPYSPDFWARLAMTPVTTVAGCAVKAHVYYETQPVGVTNTSFGIV